MQYGFDPSGHTPIDGNRVSRSSSFIDESSDHHYVYNEAHKNLIYFLAIAQTFKLDLLPITWQPALESLGHGGTATVNQALMSVQTSFAFKRISRLATISATQAYHALISELRLLTHSAVRDHPKISRLEGYCFEVPLKGDSIWPVLVFLKAEYGNLATFRESETSKTMHLRARMKLLRDIAETIHLLHSNCETSRLLPNALLNKT